MSLPSRSFCLLPRPPHTSPLCFSTWVSLLILLFALGDLAWGTVALGTTQDATAGNCHPHSHSELQSPAQTPKPQQPCLQPPAPRRGLGWWPAPSMNLEGTARGERPQHHCVVPGSGRVLVPHSHPTQAGCVEPARGGEDRTPSSPAQGHPRCSVLLPPAPPRGSLVRSGLSPAPGHRDTRFASRGAELMKAGGVAGMGLVLRGPGLLQDGPLPRTGSPTSRPSGHPRLSCWARRPLMGPRQPRRTRTSWGQVTQAHWNLQSHYPRVTFIHFPSTH